MTEQELNAKIKTAVAEINTHPLTDYITLSPSKSGMYCCPVCGSGTGSKATGALKLYKSPQHRALCYANNCFTDKGQDTVGALQIIWKCSVTDVMKKCGYYLTEGAKTPVASITATDNTEHAPMQKITVNAPTAPTQPAKDYTEQFTAWHTFLFEEPSAAEARQYLEKRGISAEIIRRFSIGYDPSFKSDNPKIYSRDKRIIIPRNSGSFLARAIEEVELPKLIEGTQRAMFNVRAIDKAIADKTVMPIVVEGELDAASLISAGFDNCVGIGSTSNINLLAEYAQSKAPNVVYILCLDNDDTGRKKQSELAALLESNGIQYVSVDTADAFSGHKDPNDAITDAATKGNLCTVLVSAMQQAFTICAEKEKQLAMLTGNNLLDAFLKDVQSRKFEPIPTGITELDRMTNGGFLRQTLVMLGAAPGMGKTTFTQQIFEGMAKQGHNILFFNLEMSRTQLMAKSFSREIYRRTGTVITATEIMQGYKWTQRQYDLVAEEARLHAPISDHIMYNPDNTGADLESILQCMNQTANRLQAEGKEAPIVVIDYLHLITSSVREDPQETIKRAVKAFNDYAIKYNSVVFVIVAFNRESNKRGAATLESGRDSSGIEYSASLYLGLKWANLSDTEDVEDRINTFPKELQLVVLKNRLGATDSKSARMQYNFYADRNFFANVTEKV